MSQVRETMERLITERCGEREIVKQCDRVIAEATDFLLHLHDAAAAKISREEVEGIDARLLAEAAVRPHGECSQHTAELSQLMQDGARVRGATSEIVCELSGQCGACVEGGRLKSVARVLEKAMTKLERVGGLAKVCDVVRDRVVADSMNKASYLSYPCVTDAVGWAVV